MYYDQYRGKKRGRSDERGRRSGGCLGFIIKKLLKLIAVLLAIAILCAGVLYVVPIGFWNVQPRDNDLAINGDLPSDRLNVLLLGLDELDEDHQRSDTIIIVSVGKSDVRLASVQRDTMVDIPGYGRGKINSAYARGGAEMSMRCVNETFGMNITKYIVVDYITLVKLIDAAGGIDIEITDAELAQMNENVGDSAHIFKPLGYDAQPMTQSGKVHLNGLFALGYSRIRSIDTDYMRTFRQRTVIARLLESVRGNIANPIMYAKVIDVCLHYVDTNLSIPALVALGERMLTNKSIQQSRTPDKTCCVDDGSAIKISDAPQNKAILRSFLYDHILENVE